MFNEQPWTDLSDLSGHQILKGSYAVQVSATSRAGIPLHKRRATDALTLQDIFLRRLVSSLSCDHHACVKRRPS